jgi:hypothetical protein
MRSEMMKSKFSGAIFGVVIALSLSLSGCANYVAGVPAGEGKAYIIKNRSFGQDMLLCDASSGKPICRVQIEQ